MSVRFDAGTPVAAFITGMVRPAEPPLLLPFFAKWLAPFSRFAVHALLEAPGQRRVRDGGGLALGHAVALQGFVRRWVLDTGPWLLPARHQITPDFIRINTMAATHSREKMAMNRQETRSGCEA